jgi:hypothetical protein
VCGEAARIAAHVQRAERAAERIDDRCARAGEDVIRAQEVFVAVHGDGLARRERGADRVGAARAFGPRHAGAQRDAVRLLDEVRVADAVQDHAVGIGEEHEALRVGDLRVQVLHHRARVGEQRMVRVEEFAQREPRQRREIGALVRAQAERRRAGVRLCEQVVAARGGAARRLRHVSSPVGRGRRRSACRGTVRRGRPAVTRCAAPSGLRLAGCARAPGGRDRYRLIIQAPRVVRAAYKPVLLSRGRLQ